MFAGNLINDIGLPNNGYILNPNLNDEENRAMETLHKMSMENVCHYENLEFILPKSEIIGKKMIDVLSYWCPPMSYSCDDMTSDKLKDELMGLSTDENGKQKTLNWDQLNEIRNFGILTVESKLVPGESYIWGLHWIIQTGKHVLWENFKNSVQFLYDYSKIYIPNLIFGYPKTSLVASAMNILYSLTFGSLRLFIGVPEFKKKSRYETKKIDNEIEFIANMDKLLKTDKIKLGNRIIDVGKNKFNDNENYFDLDILENLKININNVGLNYRAKENDIIRVLKKTTDLEDANYIDPHLPDIIRFLILLQINQEIYKNEFTKSNDLFAQYNICFKYCMKMIGEDFLGSQKNYDSREFLICSLEKTKKQIQSCNNIIIGSEYCSEELLDLIKNFNNKDQITCLIDVEIHHQKFNNVALKYDFNSVYKIDPMCTDGFGTIPMAFFGWKFFWMFISVVNVFISVFKESLAKILTGNFGILSLFLCHEFNQQNMMFGNSNNCVVPNLAHSIRKLWNYIIESRNDFEMEQDTSIIGKTFTRPINILWNYIIKGLIGTLIILITFPSLCLIKIASWTCILILSPIISIVSVISIYLFNIFVLINYENKCKCFPFFEIYFGKLFFGGILLFFFRLIGVIILIVQPVLGSIYFGISYLMKSIYDLIIFWVILVPLGKMPIENSFLVVKIKDVICLDESSKKPQILPFTQVSKELVIMSVQYYLEKLEEKYYKIYMEQIMKEPRNNYEHQIESKNVTWMTFYNKCHTMKNYEKIYLDKLGNFLETRGKSKMLDEHNFKTSINKCKMFENEQQLAFIAAENIIGTFIEGRLIPLISRISEYTGDNCYLEKECKKLYVKNSIGGLARSIISEMWGNCILVPLQDRDRFVNVDTTQFNFPNFVTELFTGEKYNNLIQTQNNIEETDDGCFRISNDPMKTSRDNVPYPLISSGSHTEKYFDLNISNIFKWAKFDEYMFEINNIIAKKINSGEWFVKDL
jgi:hypothetical protein